MMIGTLISSLSICENDLIIFVVGAELTKIFGVQMRMD